MSNHTPPSRGLSPDDALPPVEPPSAGFILQLFIVPGVIVVVVTLVTLLLTSMAVVREKEIGTMEQIMVTPITRIEFVLGKTVPFALIGFADVLIIACCWVWLTVEMSRPAPRVVIR